ncbi:MAG: histidine phosphatase family protein [Hyphomicrobiales bacterium]|nr:histidine phosphatase family protein [Hyphomicrobiales bacterium]
MSSFRLPKGLTLYLIRHGETDWNAEGRLQGGRDIPLNDFGRVQAEEAGRKLRESAPHAEDLDYLCSPLGRARETMEIARRAIGLHPTDYETDERLRELTFGNWEGMTWREVRASAPQAAREREANKWHYAPPQGESYEMLLARTMPVFEQIRRDTVIVSHGGVMRVAFNGFGFETKGVAEDLDIWQGRIVIVTSDGYRWY